MSPPRLYLVAPPLFDREAVRALAAVLDDFEIACVRLAPAALSDVEIRRQAAAVRDLCRERGASLVLADHFRLVPELGLDGVHLSTGPRHVREARKHLGADAIVGAFCGTSRHDGMIAAEVGADYVSFGPLTASALGDGAVAPLELFAWWAEMIEVPLVAEGGLTPENAAALAGHADFFALGAELWSDPTGPAPALAAIVARLSAAHTDAG